MKLLAKSSVCPGIITIIWSLITTDIGDKDDENAVESDPDDQVIELINNSNYRENLQEKHIEASRNGAEATTKNKQVKPLDMGLNEGNEMFNDQKTSSQEGALKQQKINDILFGPKSDKIWLHNYMSGTKYELYQVPLKGQDYSGLKFRDVVMILYQKMNIFLIALEVRILNQTMVFVNPSEYTLEHCDYYGYCIHYTKPDFDEINNLDLNKTEAKNFFIMDYLNKGDPI